MSCKLAVRVVSKWVPISGYPYLVNISAQLQVLGRRYVTRRLFDGVYVRHNEERLIRHAGSQIHSERIDLVARWIRRVGRRRRQVLPDGSFVVVNVPVELGLYRLRVTCTQGNTTAGAQSEFVTLTLDQVTEVTRVLFSVVTPIPVSLRIQAPTTIR